MTKNQAEQMQNKLGTPGGKSHDLECSLHTSAWSCGKALDDAKPSCKVNEVSAKELQPGLDVIMGGFD